MSFMSKFVSKTSVGALAISAAVLTFSGTTAEAVTVTFTGGTGGSAGAVITGNGTVAQNNFGDGSSNIDFRWNNTSPDNYLAYSEFTADSSFNLTFQDYSPESDLVGATGARSGFQLYSGSFGGSLTSLVAPNHQPNQGCGSDVATNFGSSDCVLVTGAGNDPTAFLTPVSSFEISGPGTYVLMFSEGNEPNNGSAEFIISAVPLPAGGLLLLTALGGLAAARRRRKAA